MKRNILIITLIFLLFISMSTSSVSAGPKQVTGNYYIPVYVGWQWYTAHVYVEYKAERDSTFLYHQLVYMQTYTYQLPFTQHTGFLHTRVTRGGSTLHTYGLNEFQPVNITPPPQHLAIAYGNMIIRGWSPKPDKIYFSGSWVAVGVVAPVGPQYLNFDIDF